MKLLIILIYILGILATPSITLAAEKPKAKTKVANKCSAADIKKFREAYANLQNAYKYEGKNIKVINGKSQAVGEATDAEHSPGQKLEEDLYKQYKNALVKVGKIYQQINKEPTDANKTLLAENSDLKKFFSAIADGSSDPDKKVINSLDIHSLLQTLAKVETKDFKLKPEDTYLLEKLLIHSQDRICTLNQYNKSKNHSKITYLDNLKRDPLNKMIESLRSLDKTKDLQFADEELTISQAVKDSLAQLRKIVKDNKACEAKFKNGPLLGDAVQTCNYKSFLDSILTTNKFNEIESILHFLNANQHAKGARTDLDWLNTQFLNESKTSCLKKDGANAIYVQNLPYITGSSKIDPSKISCSKGSISLTPDECVKGLSFEIEDGLGTKVSPKKTTGITAFSIKGGKDCENVMFAEEAKALSLVVDTDEKKCTDKNIKDSAPIVEWKKDTAGKFICYDLKADCKEPSKWDDKKGCMPPQSTEEKSCTDKNVKDNAPIVEWKKDAAGKFICYDLKADCKEPSKWDDKKGCMAPPLTEEKICTDKNIKDNAPIVEWKKDAAGKFICYDLKADCKEPSKWDDKKGCMPPPSTEEKSCTDKNVKDNAPIVEWKKDAAGKFICYDLKADCKEPSKWDDKKGCSAVLTSEEKCIEDRDSIKNRELTPGTIYWDEKEKICKDKRDKKPEKTDASIPEGDKVDTIYSNKPIPARFQPVQIPTRQVYILPGMP